MKKNNFAKTNLHNNFTKTIGYENLYPSFNFSYYDSNTKYFSVKDNRKIALFDLLKSLSVFSALTWKEIKTSRQFHFHPIQNDNNIYNALQKHLLIDEVPELYQFKLQGAKESRIIGFFDDKNVLSVFVYDIHHNVYKRK